MPGKRCCPPGDRVAGAAPPPSRSRVTAGMASPRSPAAGALAGDEAIWRKLREAGFDEESVRRRDKAALIAYISRLESEVPHSLPSPSLPRRVAFDWPGSGSAVLGMPEQSFWGFFRRGEKER